MTARPGILAAFLNAAFGLGLADAADARDWLRSGGWTELDRWVSGHRGDPDRNPGPHGGTGKAEGMTTP